MRIRGSGSASAASEPGAPGAEGVGVVTRLMSGRLVSTSKGASGTDKGGGEGWKDVQQRDLVSALTRCLVNKQKGSNQHVSIPTLIRGMEGHRYLGFRISGRSICHGHALRCERTPKPH